MSSYVGLDLGQLQDYSALAVVNVPDPEPPPPETDTLFTPVDGGKPSLLKTYGQPVPPPPKVKDGPPMLTLSYLHRWPLGTKYGGIVAAVKAFLASPLAGDRPRLVIDGTGVGVAVLELFDAAKVRYEAVSIHGGERTTRDGKLWRVPKAALVAALQVPLQSGRLRVEPPGMPFADELRAEMGNFRRTLTVNAHESYAAWREGDHDDLVLALAIACWRATKATARMRVL